MSAQWSPQYQQAQQQQYQQVPQFQQSPQYQQPPQYQHYQQPQHQQNHQIPLQQPQYPQPQSYPAQHPQVPPQQYQQPSQVYSQPQSYQPQEQYIQGQQYVQAGQYSQAQSYQQQPQNYPQAQQQGYNGYQQQYPAQQYHSQPYPPQQQYTPQHVTYQQTHQNPPQQQAVPAQSQFPVSVIPNVCYNCGTPNHFAQDCPEPKRAVPAGALDLRGFSEPYQRPKPATQAVNQSSPPPSAGTQVQGHTQAYPPSNYVSNFQPQNQAQYYPVTPTSAQSPAEHQAWQQYWQWQAYHQQQSSQHHAQQQGPAYAQQPYSAPVNQAVGYSGHNHKPGPVHLQASQYNPKSQLYQAQVSQSHHTQAQGIQSPTATPISAKYYPQQPGDRAEGTAAPQRQSSTLSVSAQSPSALTNSSRQENTAEDSEELDLNSLDIPDLPKDISTYLYLPNTIISSPVSLIGMPLPANFVVADALYPISPPAPETEGRCQSKYLRDITLDTLYENITVSKYWKDHQDDTAFLARPNDDDVVPVDEVRAQLRERYINGEPNEEPARQTRSESRSSTALRKDSVNARTRLEQLEIEKAETLAKIAAKERQRALKRGEQVSPPSTATEGTPNDRPTIVKEEQVTPTRSSISEKAMTYEQNTEDVLAALGVTGIPKPITTTTAAYSGFIHDQPNRTWPGATRHHGNLHDKGTTSYSPDSGPPPPPPPPTRRAPFPYRPNGSPPSVAPNSVNGLALVTNGAESGNAYYTNGADGEVGFPSEALNDQSNFRKRSYSRRDSSSSEEDTPARRQEDDVTPKLKRHQPKVAAAYSRRW